MQSNIGLVDRYIRIAGGLLAFGAGLGMRRGSGVAKAALMSVGAMKIAEGITGFCPLMYAAGVKSLSETQSAAGRGEPMQAGRNGGQRRDAGSTKPIDNVVFEAADELKAAVESISEEEGPTKARRSPAPRRGEDKAQATTH
jgi:hypothetical protein